MHSHASLSSSFSIKSRSSLFKSSSHNGSSESFSIIVFHNGSSESFSIVVLTLKFSYWNVQYTTIGGQCYLSTEHAALMYVLVPMPCLFFGGGCTHFLMSHDGGGWMDAAEFFYWSISHGEHSHS